MTAADGVEGLERFKAEPFDLVLLDVMLPRLDGYEVCRQIRRTSTVPIVMLTARGDTMDVVVGLEAGADDYVRKPFDLPELIARVRAALRRAGAGAGPRTRRRSGSGTLAIDVAGRTVARDGVDIPSRGRSSTCSWSSSATPARSCRGTCCSIGSGATTTSATRASSTSRSSGSGRRSRPIPRRRS